MIPQDVINQFDELKELNYLRTKLIDMADRLVQDRRQYAEIKKNMKYLDSDEIRESINQLLENLPPDLIPWNCGRCNMKKINETIKWQHERNNT